MERPSSSPTAARTTRPSGSARADAEPCGLGRRDALAAGAADALMILVAGARGHVLAVAVDAHAAGALDRVLVATLAPAGSRVVRRGRPGSRGRRGS